MLYLQQLWSCGECQQVLDELKVGVAYIDDRSEERLQDRVGY